MKRSLVKVLESVAPDWVDRLIASSFARPRRRPLLDDYFDPLGLPQHLSIVGESVAVWDRGAGPTVLLVHGWEGTHRDLDVFSEVLLRAGLRIIAVDFPGHGLSSGRTLSVPVMARVIKQVLAIKGADGLKAAIAHSLGGAAVITAMAELGLNAPLALLGAPTQAKSYLINTIRSFGLRADRYDGVRLRYLKLSRIDIDDLDATRLASRLRSRTLLVYGDRDRLVPVSEGERYQAHLRNSDIEVLEGASHRSLLCDCRAVARVLRFITGSQSIDASVITRAISRFQRAREPNWGIWTGG